MAFVSLRLHFGAFPEFDYTAAGNHCKEMTMIWSHMRSGGQVDLISESSGPFLIWDFLGFSWAKAIVHISFRSEYTYYLAIYRFDGLSCGLPRSMAQTIGGCQKVIPFRRLPLISGAAAGLRTSSTT
jgi:hypothetical protein